MAVSTLAGNLLKGRRIDEAITADLEHHRAGRGQQAVKEGADGPQLSVPPDGLP
jgi:hypothetical protein